MFSHKECPGWTNWSYLILRIGFGLFMFFMGLPKLMALIGGNNPLAGFGIAIWLAWIVAAIEIIGGLLLLIGLGKFCAGGLIAIVLIVALIYQIMGGLNSGAGTISLLSTIFQHLLYIGAAMWFAFEKGNFAALDGILCKKK